MCPSLIQIGSKTAEKKLCTNKQTNRHYENNGHLAVNQYRQACAARNAAGNNHNVFAPYYASALYAMAICVRPSVCLCGTSWSSTKTAIRAWDHGNNAVGVGLQFFDNKDCREIHRGQRGSPNADG